MPHQQEVAPGRLQHRRRYVGGKRDELADGSVGRQHWGVRAFLGGWGGYCWMAWTAGPVDEPGERLPAKPDVTTGEPQ
ncbi:hypothetical protein LA76x_2405 [Lysobacter antibioticus]|uniref:Uncharacterized protein n=1 Tax=Lysobacter antibioticus TaxID=84531 RepID=A0A0S2FAG7_LYSAN|nr:hypothetical protein LA76x_2405 [Lysobacter antibioticus]